MIEINSFDKLFKDSIKPINYKQGSKIKGYIIDRTKESFIVDVGLKSYAIVPLAQFQNCYGDLTAKIGDKFDFILENIEDGSGVTIISREKAKKEETWVTLQQAHKEGTIVYGKVIGKVKGGLSLDIECIPAFLPGSLVDCRLNKEFMQNVEGQLIEVKVIKLDHERKNVVVSRKAVVEGEQIKLKQALIASLEEDNNNIITGHVKNITDYGAFIDLGNGIDGLLHITDISWKRIKHPKEILTIGQKLQVTVIKYDTEKNRISLGLKQLTEDPWDYLTYRYPAGQVFKGKVSNILEYGCFVEIENGIEGLVHISEITWLYKGLSPAKLVKLGQEVNFVILSVDNQKRRISLGMKQCIPNPWQEFCINYKNGDIIQVMVKSITDFGLFVELPKYRFDGLVHISDITWHKFSKDRLYKNYKIGDTIQSMILNIDLNKERIALGIKQIMPYPFYYFISKVKKGHIVIGKVIYYDPNKYKLTLKLKDILNINISLKEYLKKTKYNFITPINIDDKFYVKIMDIDMEDKVIEIDFLDKLNNNKYKTPITKRQTRQTRQTRPTRPTRPTKPTKPKTTLGLIEKNAISNW